MLENYMSINNVWMPVVVTDTPPADGIITEKDVRYSVTAFRDNMYIIRSKERITLPDDAKQQISDLQSANTALGQQVTGLTLAGAQKDAQITQLGQQIVQMQLDIAKGGTAS